MAQKIHQVLLGHPVFETISCETYVGNIHFLTMTTMFLRYSNVKLLLHRSERKRHCLIFISWLGRYTKQITKRAHLDNREGYSEIKFYVEREGYDINDYTDTPAGVR